MNARQDMSPDLTGAVWRKSSYSSANGQCVEVARLTDGGWAVRNSREPEKEPHIFTDGEFAAFRAGVKAGEFDS
jgi:Domain of unknown function (DUF397)